MVGWELTRLTQNKSIFMDVIILTSLNSRVTHIIFASSEDESVYGMTKNLSILS